jgi:hypothetical protein
MKLILRLVAVAVAVTVMAVAPVLAQEESQQPSEVPFQRTTMSEMMDSADGHAGMMQMMEVMNHCMSMMETMPGSGEHGHGGMGMGHEGQMTPGMMPEMMGGQATEGEESVEFGRRAAESIARAFLAGRSPDAIEIREITLEAGVYTVAYRQGDDEGELAVDAATGEVRSELPER